MQWPIAIEQIIAHWRIQSQLLPTRPPINSLALAVSVSVFLCLFLLLKGENKRTSFPLAAVAAGSAPRVSPSRRPLAGTRMPQGPCHDVGNTTVFEKARHPGTVKN